MNVMFNAYLSHFLGFKETLERDAFVMGKGRRLTVRMTLRKLESLQVSRFVFGVISIFQNRKGLRIHKCTCCQNLQNFYTYNVMKRLRFYTC